MTDYGTIKIPEAAYEEHNERRQEMGLTWEAYINGEAPDEPGSVDTEVLGREVARQIDYAHLSDRVSEQVAKQLQR